MINFVNFYLQMDNLFTSKDISTYLDTCEAFLNGAN